MKSLLLASSVFTGIVLSSCGSSGGGDSGGNGDMPRTNSNLTSISLEGSNLTVKDANGRDVLFQAKALVNGREAFKSEFVKYSEITQRVTALNAGSSQVNLELTAYDNDKRNILATNVSDSAMKSDTTKDIWNRECSGVSTALSANPNSGQGRPQYTLSICDFTGVTMAPIVQVAAQPQRFEKRTVIYHCQVTSVGSSYMFTNSKFNCEYGYDTLPGETSPEISVLKRFAPGSAEYAANPLVLQDMSLQNGNSGVMKMRVSYEKLPFGSAEGCGTEKIDVKFNSAQGIQTKRLTFSRQRDASGDVVLIPQNSGDWPKFDDVLNYYRNAQNEKIDIYRICEWVPSTQDLLSGNVITVRK